MGKTQKPTIKKLKAKLDTVFSVYIRRRDNGICYTCSTKKPWKEMQAGHFVSRSANALRYDERNVHCQDAICNIFKHGNLDVYALRLVEDFGPHILQELNQQKHKVKQFSIMELQGLIHEYQTKLMDLGNK